MAQRFNLGSISVVVTKKDIKNVHLSVHPPIGRVRVSAPLAMKLDTIRIFTISKLDWIKLQQKKLREQEREPKREYVERESHYLWGKRYLLKVVESDSRPSIELKHDLMVLTIRPGARVRRKREFVEEWYRVQVRGEVPSLIAKWEPILGVRVDRVFVQRMRTKWGGCNPTRGTIRLNTDLAKKPRQCLEYLVVHEMVHLLEPTHNARFVELMDRFMPQWKFYREQLNRLPVRHMEWVY